MNIEIANKLLKLRKEKGLSQEQLANELGISRQAVSKWERAEASPDTDNLIALAKLYGISLDELLLHEPLHKITDTNENNEEYVHVGLNGVHVKENHGDEVHIGFDGIHINEYDGHKVDVDGHGIHIDDEHYDKEYFKHWYDDKKDHFPLGVIVFFGLLIYACFTNHWHPTWIFILAIPIVESLITAIKKGEFSKFAYPVLVAMIYLYLGFYKNYWHPGWVIFLTIPIYYNIAHYLDKKTF